MSIAQNRKAVLSHFQSLPNGVQNHFEIFPALIKSEFPFEVALGYLFYRVELAHRDTLYCGVVKLHHANAPLARRAVQEQHLTRAEFHAFFESLFQKSIPKPIVEKLEASESVRDKAIHGREPTKAMMRKAIVDVLDYAREYNDFVKSLAHFPPFGDLRGFHGRGNRLTNSTTRLLLRGVGFKLA